MGAAPTPIPVHDTVTAHLACQLHNRRMCPLVFHKFWPHLWQGSRASLSTKASSPATHARRSAATIDCTVEARERRHGVTRTTDGSPLSASAREASVWCPAQWTAWLKCGTVPQAAGSSTSRVTLALCAPSACRRKAGRFRGPGRLLPEVGYCQGGYCHPSGYCIDF